jgi:hypothetical protein
LGEEAGFIFVGWEAGGALSCLGGASAPSSSFIFVFFLGRRIRGDELPKSLRIFLPGSSMGSVFMRPPVEKKPPVDDGLRQY